MPESTRRHPKLKPVPKIPPLQPTEDPNKSEGITRRFLQELAATVESLRFAMKGSYGSKPSPHGATHDVGGSDPLDTPGTPTNVVPSATADAGTGPAYALEDHTHGSTAAAPGHVALASAAGSPASGSSDSFARADHDHGDIKREVEVESAGVLVAVRRMFNIVSGATVADNAGADRVDITIPPSASSILTTAGDIIVRDATTAARHGIGNQHDILEVETGNADKVQWSSLATILKRILTGRGIIVRDGSGNVIQRALDPAYDGFPLWIDARNSGGQNDTLLGIGDDDPQGYPHRGGWYIANAIANGTAFPLFDLTANAALDSAAVEIDYAAYYDDATDVQGEMGHVSISIARKAGTWAAGTVTSYGAANNPSAGALTVAITVDPGHDISGAVDATKVTIKATLTSTLGNPLNYAQLKWKHHNFNEQALTFATMP